MTYGTPGALRPAGPLRPPEMAQAAVMAALCAACAVIAVIVPFGQVFSLLGTVPMGLLAYRYRIRVLIAALVAGGVITFLVAGLGGFMTVANCAYIGGLTGVIKRRGRGWPTMLFASLIAGAAFGAFAVGALALLSRLRHLIFETITANVEGSARFVEYLADTLRGTGMAQLADQMHLSAGLVRDMTATALRYWPLLVGGYAILAIMVVSAVGFWALSKVLEALRGVPDVHKLETPPPGPVGPLPVRLHHIGFRYPGADHDALAPMSMDINPGEHVAVVGANGSGKTTLMLILAGRPPTTGTVDRPGAVGLGEFGGTAVVLQHPETQVLGSRVADDVVWGLPNDRSVDVDRLLDEVGLGGMGERDTGGLSGGELQRLAIAGALAREPALLIADEVTSMVDQAGRDALRDVLAGLTDRHGLGLVQITHYANEAEAADRVVNLSDSVDNTSAMVDTAAAPRATTERPAGKTIIELDRVGHTYGAGTPWAKVALRDITFQVHEGDGVLIHGGNGCGKSTLAWIMAGLIRPSTGSCLVGGLPADGQVGTVAVAFQAARLQLLRPRVDLDVAAAAGFSPYDTPRVAAALATVGLDAALARRRIDQLSGGQMRRVVLAGLLARRPRVLILDEPLAGLDAASQRNLVRLLVDLRRQTGLTVVVISHDFVGLEELCPRIVHLDAGVQRLQAPAGELS